MMQSSDQLVIWIPLTTYDESLGGVECFPRSHLDGLVEQVGQGDYYEVAPSATARSAAHSDGPVRLPWNLGDVAMFHGFLQHRTIPNTNSDRVRVIQTFRVSDLSRGSGLEYNFRSTGYVDRNYEDPKNLDFRDQYPRLMILGEA